MPEPHWDLAFAVLLAYLFVEYSNLPTMYPILQPLRLGKALVFLCALGAMASEQIRNQRNNSHDIDFTLLVFFLACCSSALFAVQGQEAWGGVGDVFRWLVIYFLISRILTNPWRLRIALFLLLVLHLKMAQFAIRDYFAQRSYGRSDEFLSAHGVGAGTANFFGNAGDFGVAMCVIWALAASLFFGETKKGPRIFYGVCFALFFMAIMVCGSRGAVLGAAAAALATWAKNPKRIGGMVMTLVLLITTVYFLPEASKQRMLSGMHWEKDETATIRIGLWKAGLRMFQDNPVFGVGLGNFPHTFATHYNDFSTKRSYAPGEWVPHSIYIQALSELGVMGSLPLLAILFLFFRLNGLTRKRLKTIGFGDRRNFEYRLSLGLDLALVTYLVTGAFLTVLFYPHLWVLLGFSVALHTACLNKRPKTSVAQPSDEERALVLAAS
jgi:putative inorganic carbon (hco3(-)) transporter